MSKGSIAEGIIALVMLIGILFLIYECGNATYADGRAKGACEGSGGTIQDAYGGNGAGWYCVSADGRVIEVVP